MNKLKAVNASFHKILECPVCLGLLEVPFKQCANGHLICAECTKHLKGCPLCQAEFIAAIPVCVKNILEGLPKFCKYADDGCQEMLSEGDDHECLCGFRPVGCWANGCKENVLAKNIFGHLKKKHAGRHTFCREDNTVLWKLNFKKKQLKYLPIHVFGIFFIIEIDNDPEEKQFKQVLKSVPVGKVDDDYFACVQFINGDHKFIYTLKASVVHSRNETGKDEAELKQHKSSQSDGYCMKVPHDALPNFVNKEGKLEFTIKMIKNAK